MRQITGRNTLQVRKFSGSSALLPALKSVQNRVEILDEFYLKNRLEKRTPGGIENIWTFPSEKVKEKIFEISS